MEDRHHFMALAVLCLMTLLAPSTAKAGGLIGPLEAAAVREARTFDGVNQPGGVKPVMTVLTQAAGEVAPKVPPATRMPKGTGLQSVPVPATGKGGRRESRGWSYRKGSMSGLGAEFFVAMVAAAALNAIFPGGLSLAAVLGIVGGVLLLAGYAAYRNRELPWQSKD